MFVLCGNINLNVLGLDHIVYLLALTAWVVKFLKHHESVRAESQQSLLQSPRWYDCGQQDAMEQHGESSAVCAGAPWGRVGAESNAS